MRVHEERKYFVYRDDEDWPQFSMRWGDLKRPITCQPTSVTLTWYKGGWCGHASAAGSTWDESSWHLHSVYVMADRIYHGQRSHSVSVRAWAQETPDIDDTSEAGPRPQWLVDLIAQCNPMVALTWAKTSS